MSLARQPLRRVGAAGALGLSLLAVTGCGYIHSQPTLIQYDASDGVSADFGDVEARNIFVVANDAESEGRLLGALVNTGDQDVTVTIDTGEATAEVELPAGGEVRFDQEETLVDPAGVLPGKMLMGTTFSDGRNEATADVPVLDGALEEYREYIPGGSDYTPPAEPDVEH